MKNIAARKIRKIEYSGVNVNENDMGVVVQRFFYKHFE